MNSTEMVTLFISAFALIAIIGIGLYFWLEPARYYSENILPPQPDARGLFADDPSIAEAEVERLAIAAAEHDEALLSRARNGERAALIEAHSKSDGDLYQRALSELVEHADSDAKLLALMSYVTQNELPVNVKLAQAVTASWQRSPDRNLTAKALHFAALSDDADTYRGAVESAMGLWRDGKIANVSAAELRALFDGEFWILSSQTRSSGAGFVLKRTLESARRELEAATGAHQ